MNVSEEDVKILYDLCIASMDFGSGFLDREDYETLQRIAATLGVEYPVCDEPIIARGRGWPGIGEPPPPRCVLPKQHFGSHKKPGVPLPSEDLQRIVDVVETWDVQRKLVKTFTRADLDRFSGTMNDRTRQLIAAFGRESIDFYSALAELSVHAQTYLDQRAKFIVDGYDNKRR